MNYKSIKVMLLNGRVIILNGNDHDDYHSPLQVLKYNLISCGEDKFIRYRPTWYQKDEEYFHVSQVAHFAWNLENE